MPMKRLSMRKLKEVLRLRYELGLGQHQIARSCSIAQGTVSEYLRRAREAGISWPLPEGWNDRQLEAALFGGTPRHAYPTHKPQPDFAQLHEELPRHPHLTLQLAGEEYRQAHPDGYAYSRFCELYQRWREQLDVVLRQDHVAGEKLFVDYAGATIPIHDPQGGPERQAAIFVAVLGASTFTRTPTSIRRYWAPALSIHAGRSITSSDLNRESITRAIATPATTTAFRSKWRSMPPTASTSLSITLMGGVTASAISAAAALTTPTTFATITDRSVSTPPTPSLLPMSGTFLPYGRGQRWGSANSKALDLLLGGWSVDGITTLESGHPFSPVVSNTASVNDPDFSGVRADRVGSAHIAGQSAAEWFNVASFNNSLWGPAQYVVNLALEKTFNITENKTLEFRWENFNAFNIDNYGMPANTVDVSGTGQITSTAIPMRQMQFGLHFRF